MTPFHHALEVFFDQLQPLGVAFVGSARLAITFGRPPERVAWTWENREGFIQHHSEEAYVSVYASSFGWGKFLVAQFSFQDQYPPPLREWQAFVRLASTLTRILESPQETSDPGIAGVAVPRPHPAPQRSGSAEAPLGDPPARP